MLSRYSIGYRQNVRECFSRFGKRLETIFIIPSTAEVDTSLHSVWVYSQFYGTPLACPLQCYTCKRFSVAKELKRN